MKIIVQHIGFFPEKKLCPKILSENIVLKFCPKNISDIIVMCPSKKFTLCAPSVAPTLAFDVSHSVCLLKIVGVVTCFSCRLSTILN